MSRELSIAVSNGAFKGIAFKMADLDIDPQPVNVLFSVADIEDNQEFLESLEFGHVKEGKHDASVPKYLMIPQRRRAELGEIDASKLVIKIGRLSQGKAHLLSPQIYQESHI